MTNKEIKTILEEHKKWLNGDGWRIANLKNADLSNTDLSYACLIGADLRHANLSHANLSHANLSYAHLETANLKNADLGHANLKHADLESANLTGSNLMSADLKGAHIANADLMGANVDFSCLALWCGSLSARFDDKQLCQIAYHLVKAGLNSKNASNETKKELNKLVQFANRFHRVDECGKIEPFDVEETKNERACNVH